MRRDSFERFYFEKMALGEGCGCAEHVTRMRELDSFAKERSKGRLVSSNGAFGLGWLVRLARRVVGRANTPA